MISDAAKEALSSTIVPVMLGDGPKARMLAARLFLKYGVQSIICDEKQSAWRFVFGFGGFYKIIKSSESRLVAEELERIADVSSGGLLFVAPCSADFSRLLEEVTDRVETRFIIASSDDLLDKIAL